MKKMRKMKRAVGILMAVLMIVTMAVPAMAANGTPEEGKGTITIENPTPGVTYTLYRIFDATVNQSGDIAYSYPLEKDFAENDYYERDSAGNILVKEAAYLTGEDKKPIKDRLSTGAIEWIKTFGEKDNCLSTQQQTVPTPAEGQTVKPLVFDNLPYGYYYVTSTLKDNGAITVTSTNPEASIVDKNQGPTWTPDPDDPNGNNGKKIVTTDGLVDTNSLNYGDEVEFQISIDATNYDGEGSKENQIKKYYVIDKLQNGFDFEEITSITVDGSPVDVTINDKEYKAGEYTGFEKEDLIEEKETKDQVEKIYNKFVVEFEWARKDSKSGVWNSLYPANSHIVIRYKATLNDNAVIAGDGNENKAKFVYIYTDMGDPEDPDPETPNPGLPSVDEEVTKTYTYAIAVKKVNKDGAGLANAKFDIKAVTLTEDQKNALADGTLDLTSLEGLNCTAIKVSDITDGGTDRIYKYDNTKGTEISSANPAVSPDSGIIIVKGVKAGDYVVTETEAPAGYNKLVSSEIISATIEGEYEAKIITVRNSDGEVIDQTVENREPDSDKAIEDEIDVRAVPIVIKNTKGVLLPSTGGMGTTIFYIIGGILVIGAGVLLVTKKRMGSK